MKTFEECLAHAISESKEFNEFMPNLEKHMTVEENCVHFEADADSAVCVMEGTGYRLETVHRIPQWNLAILQCVDGVTLFVSEDYSLGAQVSLH